MANTEKENLFRFISLRPTKLGKGAGKYSHVVPADGVSSAFDADLKNLVKAGATLIELAPKAVQFVQSPLYIKVPEDMGFPVSLMMDWLGEKGNLTFKSSDFVKSMEVIAGKDLKTLVKDQLFLDSYSYLCSSVLADVLCRNPLSDKVMRLTAIKILHTLYMVGTKKWTLDNTEVLDNFFGKGTVVFPLLNAILERPAAPKKDLTHVPDKVADKQAEEAAKQAQLMEHLEQAHREITMMAFDESHRRQPKVNPKSPKLVDKKVTDKTIVGNDIEMHPEQKEFLLSSESISQLSKSTQGVLAHLRVNKEMVNPVKLVNRIEKEISYQASRMTNESDQNSVIALGGVYVDRKAYKKSSSSRNWSKKDVIEKLHKCIYKAGIGDLLIVRQELKAYELADFAHVENALSGEFRERSHKRIDLTEEITTTTTETETTKERDLQTTERSEMQTEAEKTVQSQTKLEAGLQVSGSYGPAISFSSSLNAGFSSSVQEAQSKSTMYSREVTEKSSEKVRTKVTEEYRRRVLHKIIETNTHRIDNTKAGAEHVRGVYRWLNKIYDAQIFNYGQRMMYEFVIPEPASFFLYATVDHPPVDAEIIKPELPTYNGYPLKPENLTRTNYHKYVSLYQVTNAPEPPSQFTVKSQIDKLDGKDENHFGRAYTVSIPSDYEAYGAYMSYNSIFIEDHKSTCRLMIGGLTIERNYWGAEYRNFPSNFRGEVSIAISLMNKMSFTFSADIFCSLTDEAFAKWQHSMFDAIMQAYLNMKANYDAQMEQKDIQKGIEILGRNPIENRRIEREELKKMITMIMTNNPYINLDGYLDNNPYDPTQPDEPILDLSTICPNGAWIRFFENAFEWNNMTYVFYPYFWGRHANWINALHITDPDLDFAAFLKAGAARVQVPVRPGFERAVALFCQTGLIWEGNDVPLIGDDLYVPIVKEITENLGKIEDGVPYPEDSKPWEVTVPTSLVVLQDLEEVPNIRDILTGNPIDIQNKA